MKTCVRCGHEREETRFRVIDYKTGERGDVCKACRAQDGKALKAARREATSKHRRPAPSFQTRGNFWQEEERPDMTEKPKGFEER